MGVTTGFLSGVTLTTLTLYLSLSWHRQARLDQSLGLRQSLAKILDATDPDDKTSSRLARHNLLLLEEHTRQEPGLAERFKTRWNAELVGALRRVQTVDWAGVRTRLEDGVGAGWGAVMQKTRDGVIQVENTANSTSARDLETGVERVGRHARGTLHQRHVSDRRREGY